MKAMRDEKGEMVRNGHLLGFFRRICKLLFLRTKPVFVFDGGTPALKRRTVVARRRQRENAQAKIRKTAEKLLLNHVSFISLLWIYYFWCCILVILSTFLWSIPFNSLRQWGWKNWLRIWRISGWTTMIRGKRFYHIKRKRLERFLKEIVQYPGLTIRKS